MGNFYVPILMTTGSFDLSDLYETLRHKKKFIEFCYRQKTHYVTYTSNNDQVLQLRMNVTNLLVVYTERTFGIRKLAYNLLLSLKL